MGVEVKEDQAGALEQGQPTQPEVKVAGVSRRMLIRGAVAAVPTILTLNSGAALANASNMMVGVQSSTGGTASTAQDGVYHCLDTGGLQGENPWDLGVPGPSNLVTNIPRTEQPYQYTLPNSSPPQVVSGFGDDMCFTGAVDASGNGVSQGTVPKGMLLSATAYQSLTAAGVIDYTTL